VPTLTAIRRLPPSGSHDNGLAVQAIRAIFQPKRQSEGEQRAFYRVSCKARPQVGSFTMSITYKRLEAVNHRF